MDEIENDPEADWEPYYLTADYQEKDNVYASFRDNKYVVVRKGYEHPEIVMKIISVLFDYSRFDDVENADEINSYFALNVDPTARPLVINVDYNEAIYNVTKDIRRQFKCVGEVLLRRLHEVCKRGKCDRRGLGCVQVQSFRSWGAG